MLLLLACAPAATIDPASGPSSGGVVEVSWDGGAPTNVSLGGVRAFVIEEHAGGFSLELQGSPTPGPAELRFTAEGEEVVVSDAYTFEEPIHPAFSRMAVLGASIGAGVQSAGLTGKMSQQSAPAVLAGMAGAYLGLPAMVEGLFQPMGPEEVGEGCDLPSYDAHAATLMTDALSLMRGDDGELDWGLARRDPAVEVRNVAVPGAGMEEVARGPKPGDIGGYFFAHLIWELEGDVFDTPERSELEQLVSLEPTLIVSVDLLGNDVIDALLADEGVEPAEMRPLEEARPALEEILAAAAGTGAWVFVADLPRPSAMPLATDAALRSRENGQSEEDIAAALAEVDAAAAAYNAALAEEAAAYERVVIVPLAAAVEELDAQGVVVGGETLSTGTLGGLVGLDGVHFTPTGNAILANVIAETIDATLGTAIPRADLEAVLREDPWSPAALTAAGLDPSSCP